MKRQLPSFAGTLSRDSANDRRCAKWRSDWIRRRCSITDNVVTNNVWAPCTAIPLRDVATNILVTQSDKRGGLRQYCRHRPSHIFVHGNNAATERNETFATAVFDGIRIHAINPRPSKSRI